MKGPRAAVLAVVVRDGRVLLVRRANPPDAGLWGFPGGRIELGEPIAEAALRELHEETSLRARPVRVLGALDVVEHDPAGAVRHHFVLIPVLCRWLTGEPEAGDDVDAVRWFRPEELAQPAAPGFRFSDGVGGLARSALRSAGRPSARARRARSPA